MNSANAMVKYDTAHGQKESARAMTLRQWRKKTHSVGGAREATTCQRWLYLSLAGSYARMMRSQAPHPGVRGPRLPED